MIGYISLTLLNGMVLMTRLFETGATRDADDTKLDFEGFLSPLALARFAEYMHKCRTRNVPPGQDIRASDNWQKGIPLDAYMKSMLRHVMDVWAIHRGWKGSADELEEALCAVLFNVQGYLHELRKQRLGNGPIACQPAVDESVLHLHTYARDMFDCYSCTICGEPE